MGLNNGDRSRGYPKRTNTQDRYRGSIPKIDIGDRHQGSISGINNRDRYRGSIPGIDSRDRYRGSITGIDIRDQYPGSISGIDIRDRYQESIPGIDIRDRHQGSTSGINTQDRYQGSISRIDINQGSIPAIDPGASRPSPPTGSASRSLPARRLQDGGAGAEGFGAPLPPDPAGARPRPAPRDPDGNDSPGGDEAVLGEEFPLQPTPVPSCHHLQVVAAHGHVHHPPRHRRRPQPGCVRVCRGRAAAPGALSPLPGAAAGAGPGSPPALPGQVLPGCSLFLPHLERDPAPGLGSWEGAAAAAGDPVRAAGAGPDPALLRRLGLPVTRNPGNSRNPGNPGNSAPRCHRVLGSFWGR